MPSLEDLIARRTAERRRIAEAASTQALSALHALGIDIRLFGSLRSGDFMAHSDVDFIVHSPVAGTLRVDVERAVAAAMGETGIPYDIIYLSDLSCEQARAFADG